LDRFSATEKIVLDQLKDHDRAVKARVHPLNVLIAQRTYNAGHSVRGSATWNPNKRVVDALEELFYGTFKSIETTGKNILLALDVSGSMDGGEVAGVPGLTPREASTAMALVTMNAEPNTRLVAFSSNLTVLDKITPSMRIRDAVAITNRLSFSSTNCALPMTWAQNRAEKYDSFVVYTDNETNHYGSIQPAAALKTYRERSDVRGARLVVVGMVANEFTIADPEDYGMLDVVGFDTNAPALISDFTAGRI
jgi:60 kDa SS-A/Ro ribonucleoprotein